MTALLRRVVPVLMILLLALGLSACTLPFFGTATPVPEGQAGKTPTAPDGSGGGGPATPTPDMPTGMSVEDCPEPGEGTVRHVDEENGFCLLYPERFTVSPDWPDETFAIYGPPDDPTSLEPLVVTLTVTLTGPADDMTAAEYYARWAELYNVPATPTPEQMTIGGVPAVVAAGLPARLNEQSAFIVANGLRYRVTVNPDAFDAEPTRSDIADVWRTVTESLVFFPPTVEHTFVSSREVCPQEAAGTVALIVETEGYCFLYPAQYQLDPTFRSSIVEDMTLSTEFGPVRPALTFAYAGPTLGMTAQEFMDMRSPEVVEPGSVKPITIGGVEGFEYISPEGLRARLALVVYEGSLYTLVAQPYDPVNYPQAVPALDEIWETVTGSAAFFTPWR
ncbi:MAG: hypothetical protein Kow00124_20170 [Anaerolineae bacterium]